MKFLPNVISLLRVLSVPLIIWLLVVDERQAAFWLFLVAGVSDAVDGLVAKRFDAVTELGTYLDPIADKVLLVCVYVTLGGLQLLPPWVVILVVSRDVLIVGGILFSFAISLRLTPSPSPLSKANTFVQIALATAVLGAHTFSWPQGDAIALLTYVVGALTLASGGHYVLIWARSAFASTPKIGQ